MGQTKSTNLHSSESNGKPDDDCFVDSKKFNLFTNKSLDIDNYNNQHSHQRQQSELRRGRSFINPRSNKLSSTTILSNEQNNFKRINSLPPVSRLNRIRRQQQHHYQQQSNQNDFIEHKTLSKGFDMIRHHFGQKDCELTPLLTELETSILLLNEKVFNLEQSRQDCWNKLADLKCYLEFKEQQQQQLWLNHKKLSKDNSNNQISYNKSGHILRIQFLENYMKRLENLLRIDNEPLMAIVNCSSYLPKNTTNTFTKSTPRNFNSSESNEIINNISSPYQKDFNENQQLSAIEKCQTIKKCYDYLLKSVMPQLYGNNNYEQLSSASSTSNNYQKFRQILLELRQNVQRIPTQTEQQLIDAKKAFVQEVESYLITLDQMMIKNDNTNCDYDHNSST